jgi:hypothetical protein
VTRDEAERLLMDYLEWRDQSNSDDSSKVFRAEPMCRKLYDQILDAMCHEDRPLQVTPELVANFAAFDSWPSVLDFNQAAIVATSFVNWWNARKEKT